jgi:hypothetical protein
LRDKANIQRVLEKMRECLDNSVENTGGSYSIILKLQPFFGKYRIEDLKKRIPHMSTGSFSCIIIWSIYGD